MPIKKKGPWLLPKPAPRQHQQARLRYTTKTRTRNQLRQQILSTDICITLRFDLHTNSRRNGQPGQHAVTTYDHRSTYDQQLKSSWPTRPAGFRSREHLQSTESRFRLPHQASRCLWWLIAYWQVIFIMVDVLSHLPYLEDIVFSDASKHPILAGVPGEIRDLAGMASMNEHELRRAVFCILWCLFLINPVI